MDDTAPSGSIKVPERVIPVPRSVGPEAQATLAAKRPPVGGGNAGGGDPPHTDKAAWKARIERFNASFAPVLMQEVAAMPAHVTSTTMAGLPVYVGEANTIPARNRDKAVLYFHGGGLVLMGEGCVPPYAIKEAVWNRCKVFAVDYRVPPDHPFPAALDDGVAVYRELLKTHSPKQIVITGASGGGNLAAAVPLKIRDLGLPLPAAIGLFTPEVDLTESGDSFETNQMIDTHLPKGLMETNLLYAGGHDLSDPYVSPLFGDFSKGFPPTFIQTGTRDLFLSNSVRLHRALLKAGIEARLFIGEAMPHGGFGGNTPEDLNMRNEFVKFLAKHAGWAAA